MKSISFLILSLLLFTIFVAVVFANPTIQSSSSSSSTINIIDQTVIRKRPLIRCDFLFVCRDAGETEAFIPVFPRLLDDYIEHSDDGDDDNGDKGDNNDDIHNNINVVPIAALAVTRNAKERLLSDNNTPLKNYSMRVLSLGDFGIRPRKDFDRLRKATLTADELETLFSGIQVRKAVIVGTVSSVQRQIAARWKMIPVMRPNVIGYVDSFSLWNDDNDGGVNFWGKQFIIQKAVDDLFVTAEPVAAEVRTFISKHREKTDPGRYISVRTVGQPTLAVWASVADNKAAAKRAKKCILGSEGQNNNNIFVYFGSYGGEAYNNSVRLLGQSIILLRHHNNIKANNRNNNNYYIVDRKKGEDDAEEQQLTTIITPHPGQGGKGEVEYEILSAMGIDVSIISECQQNQKKNENENQEGKPNVLIVQSNVANSSQIAAFSSLTGSHDSTCGLQSLFIGKFSAYLDPTQSYRDVATLTKLIPLVAKVTDFDTYLQFAEKNRFLFDRKRLEKVAGKYMYLGKM